MALASWTSAQIIAQLNSGTRWYGPTITFSFPTTSSGILGPSGETATFRALSTSQQTAAKLGMALWDDLIASSVSQTTGVGNVRFGLSSTATDYAHAYYPLNGSIWFSANDSGLQAPQLGQYPFETFLHEMGHALGLDHMGNYNGAGNNTPICYQDSSVYSIMSYFGPEHRSGEGQVAWADWVGSDGRLYSPQTPMLSDILAIQTVYGADTTTRTGDTVYGFNANVSGDLAAIYDFAQNAHPILTIYDAGGVNTLDLSGYSTSSTINLNSGSFTSCNAMTNNIAIAYNTAIQNAIGGSGNDVITGNVLNNLINGGSGQDTNVCSGLASDYKVCLSADGLLVKDKVSARDGTDTLKSIESIKFSNLTESINYQTGGAGITYTKFVGSVGQYSAWVGAAGVGVVDSVASRDNIQILTGIERATFTDFNLAFDTAGAAGQGYRLYKAAFDRTPDFSGLGYWIRELDAGKALTGVAGSFVASPEFTGMYGANSTDANFVKLLYNHVLHRDPDKSGYDYWLGDMSRGQTKAAVLTLFSESPENQTQTADLVANGIQYLPWA